MMSAATYRRRSRYFRVDTYGCSPSEAYALNGDAPLTQLGTMAQRYASQRKTARHRGIEWSLTFPEWASFWKDHFDARGRGGGDLCMARKGDVGPYALDNIYLSTIAENVRAMRPEVVRAIARKSSARKLGQGRGWRFKPDHKSRPYQVKCAEKHVGYFATQGEAEAAYDAAVAICLAALKV